MNSEFQGELILQLKTEGLFTFLIYFKTCITSAVSPTLPNLELLHPSPAEALVGKEQCREEEPVFAKGFGYLAGTCFTNTGYLFLSLCLKEGETRRNIS